MFRLGFLGRFRWAGSVGVLGVLAMTVGCNTDARATIFTGIENIILDLITILIEGVFTQFVNDSTPATVMRDMPQALMGFLA